MKSTNQSRYDRQIRIPEIGAAGQQKLLNTSVLLVGAGGIGSAAAFYLAAAGIGRIGIIDGDAVEPSNLNRQILHTPETLGKPKAVSARLTLERFNPAIQIDIYTTRLNSIPQAKKIFDAYDLILDCTDNYETRYLINQTCIPLEKPWIYAAVTDFEGQLTTIIPGRTPCYRCLYPEAAPPPGPPAPVIGTTPGTLGIFQACEALKFILGMGETLIGKLLFCDLSDMHISHMTLKRNPACSDCSSLF